MKKISQIFVLTLMMTFGLISAAFAAAPSVNADNSYFDFSSGCWVLEGNVVVKTDTRTIGADKAKVNLVRKEVWADGNIYLTQPEDKIEFKGGSLYASDETKTAEIKGNVLFERPDIVIKAAKCSFNWKTKLAEFNGLVEVDKDNKVETYDILHYDVIKNEIIDAK